MKRIEGQHSLRSYFRQLPAMNLEQMARQCVRPCADLRGNHPIYLIYTRRVGELSPWVPDWCPSIPLRYAFHRIDAATLFDLARQKGDRESAFYCRLLYEHGMGVPRDPFRAKTMMGQARCNGSALAETYTRACLFAQRHPIQGVPTHERLLLKLMSETCPQAPQDYDWLVLILLCFYCGQGSVLAYNLLQSWQHDQDRMQEFSDSR